MEIEVKGPTVHNGFIERAVELHEELPSGHGQGISITVWVAPSDSYTALNAAALKEARAFLERALAAMPVT